MQPAYFKLRKLTFYFFAVLLWKCSAGPDLSESQGVCKLSCSSTKIAASDNMRIRPIADGEDQININCDGIAAGQNYTGTVPLRFVVERPRIALPANNLPDDNGGNEPQPDPYDKNKTGIPVSGVSFEAVVVAGSLGPNNPNDSRFKYKGIETPKSEWCTDSCGVGTIDIRPLCTTGLNAIRMLIHSGSLASEFTVNVTRSQ